MVCSTVEVSGAAVVVCRPPQGVIRRSIQLCRTCQRRTRFVVKWGGIWYSGTSTCCACGDSWSDGERYPRPFQRAWRKAATKTARAQWDSAMSVREYAARIDAELRSYFGDGDS